MKKSISLILLLVMCLTTLIACGDPTGGDVTTTLGGDVDVTTPGADGTTIPTDDLTVGNLNGDTVKILAWNEGQIEFEYDDSVVDQVTINEAILERNEAVKDRLNCDIEVIFTAGNYDNINAYITKVESFANGDENDFVDIYGAYSMTTALASQKGFCANLMNYTKEGGLNFNNPWWPQTLVKEAMFDNMLFLCTGDISTNLLWMMETMYFSKDLLIKLEGDEKAPEKLYDLVNEGKWTIDKMIEMCTDVYSDVSQDGKKGVGDQFGYGISWNGYWDDFYVGAGFNMCERDANGKLIISSEWGGEREGNFVTKLVDFTYTKDFIYNDEAANMFKTGLVLFHNDRASFAKSARETSEIDYGILPIPKLDEAQEDYSTCIGFPHTLYAIANTSTQIESAALVLESMAAQSYFKVTPALFEDALKLRYSPELDDALMFDILKQTLCFDVGRIYCKSLEDYSWATFRNSVTAGSTAYPTKIQAAKKKAQGLVDTLIADLNKAGAIK